VFSNEINDHQQSWGYEDGPWKGPGPSLLVAADLIHKSPASIRFAPIKYALAVTVEPFKFSSRQGGVGYELSYRPAKTDYPLLKITFEYYKV
jgi:hypothetical protein